MRLQYRRLLSCFLLVTFTGISLLGEGLHWLTPETEHHHHRCKGLCTYAHKSHRANCDGHDATCHSRASADQAVCESASSTRQVTVSENDVEVHVCKICAYLFQ